MLLAPNGGQSLGLGPHTLPASPHRAHPPPEHLASQKHIGEKGPGGSQTGETNNTEGRKKRRKGRQLISSFSCLKLSITGVTPAPTQTKDNCRGLGFIPWGCCDTRLVLEFVTQVLQDTHTPWSMIHPATVRPWHEDYSHSLGKVLDFPNSSGSLGRCPTPLCRQKTAAQPSSRLVEEDEQQGGC